MIEPISKEDRARVRRAVADAEKKTSGEIFLAVAEASDDYRFIPIVWASVAALIVPLPLIYLTGLPASLIYALQLAGFVGLALVLSHPAIKPKIVPAGVKHARAKALAVQQFLAHGLHTTEARTGVLIFISIAERHAEIVADAGISAKVDQAIWQGAIDKLVDAVRDGRLADGLIAAIETTGAVLAKHFPPRQGDRNELPNDLVILD
jgi:putative membrane protein